MSSLPNGATQLEEIRICFEGSSPPAREEPPSPTNENLPVEDVLIILKSPQLEKVKESLKQIEKEYMSYSDYIRICNKNCSNVHQGNDFAKMLEESGTVIVLVSQKMMKVIKRPMTTAMSNSSDPRLKELEEMENQKTDIDKKAELMVRRELWGGLLYLIIQTAAFMWLTFWELSWDVMEPIIFYVTSMYFMAGYGFFLGTSREPSFKGFFKIRFIAKQKQLMKRRGFNIDTYNELKNVFYPNTLVPMERAESVSTSFGDV